MLSFFYKNRDQILSLTLEHLWLVGVAIAIAIIVGVPLGIFVSRNAWLRKPVLGGANVLQTIPSLALFGFLLPAPWLGERADRLAIVALVLYALLPIVRNTYTGIIGIDAAIKEAALGMGMTDNELLVHVELPLSAPFILAGIRIATVTAIGVATIAAAIGAGGLGELIFRGVAMVNDQLILAGAIPAALLALAADLALGTLENRLRVPK
jgi:osmoprotectant transport system permease protein